MNENKYIEAMKSIEISPETKSRILNKRAKQNKEGYIMMSKKKVGIVAVAAILFLSISITALAASGVISNWYSSSSSRPDYQSLPTLEQSIKDVGYAPVLFAAFDNGYVFKDGSIVENSLSDDNNNPIEQYKSFDFRYVKDGDVVMFSQEQYTSVMPPSGTLISSENGNNIYFTGYTNKIVPVSYEMTEEDIEAEQSGELVFSYGSDKVIISEIKAVSWSTGDMQFNLMQIDGKLSADDLVQMANYIIAQNE